MQFNFWSSKKYLDRRKTFWDLQKDMALVINTNLGSQLCSPDKRAASLKTKLKYVIRTKNSSKRTVSVSCGDWCCTPDWFSSLRLLYNKQTIRPPLERSKKNEVVLEVGPGRISMCSPNLQKIRSLKLIIGSVNGLNVKNHFRFS